MADRRKLTDLKLLPVYNARFDVRVPFLGSGYNNIPDLTAYFTCILTNKAIVFKIIAESIEIVVQFKSLDERNLFLKSISLNLRLVCKYKPRVDLLGCRFVIINVPSRLNSEDRLLPASKVLQSLIFSVLNNKLFDLSLDFDDLNVKSIFGKHAIMLVFNEKLTEYLLKNPNLVTPKGSIVIVRYPHVRRCKRCGSVGCNNDGTCIQKCFRCGGPHAVPACRFVSPKCPHCSVSNNRSIRRYSNHLLDSELCVYAIDELITNPRALYPV